MLSADDWWSSASREIEASSCDVYFISKFTQKTQKLTHACRRCRQVAHGGSIPTGALVAVVQHQFMLQVSDSTASVDPTCQQTHTLTPKRFIVSSFCVDTFSWKAPSCLWHQNDIKKEDKKVLLATKITTLPYIICVKTLPVPLWIIKADVELLNKSLEGGCLIFLCAAT